MRVSACVCCVAIERDGIEPMGEFIGCVNFFFGREAMPREGGRREKGREGLGIFSFIRDHPFAQIQITTTHLRAMSIMTTMMPYFVLFL